MNTYQITDIDRQLYASAETFVHPTAIIGSHVTLGQRVVVGPYAVITGNVTIGDDSFIAPHAVIGSPAQAKGIKAPLGSIVIGKNVIIKEFVTIGAPKVADGMTSIGDNCYIMNFSHVAHDVTIEHDVILTNNVQLAGHCYIEHDVLLMASASVHQFCRIGAYSGLAPYTGVRQDVPPYCLHNGQPGEFVGLHRVKLQRSGIPQESLEHLRVVTRLFYQKKLPLELLISQLESATLADSHVQAFITFVQKSTRGVSRRIAGQGEVL